MYTKSKKSIITFPQPEGISFSLSFCYYIIFGDHERGPFFGGTSINVHTPPFYTEFLDPQ